MPDRERPDDHDSPDPNQPAAYRQALAAGLQQLRVRLDDDQITKLEAHYHRVVETNRLFNLTRITKPADFAVKHHLDSLAVVRWADDHRIKVRRVLDVGTGAGLPAIPVAIARPDWLVTAIDGTAKKSNFVAQTAAALELPNLTVLHERAEHWTPDQRFDLVLFKAIGPIERCIRLARPHLARNSHAVLYKTADLPNDERTAGARCAAELGYAPAKHYDYELQLHGETIPRRLWLFRLDRL